tara:strand:+ start:531 stop:2717 length:2187 start_codon:yes stop_codon:yes gene_type:complete
MSVTNRRLFRRNARNRLNQTAGIPAVDPRLMADTARQNRMSAMMRAANPMPSRAMSRGNRAGIGTLPMFNTGAFNAFANQPASLRNLLGPEGQRLLNASRTPIPQTANDMTIDEILSGAARMDERFNQRIADAASQIPPFPPGPSAPNVSGAAENLDGSRAIPDPSAPGFAAPGASTLTRGNVVGQPGMGTSAQAGFPTLAEEEAAKAAGRREDGIGFPTLAEEEAAKAAGQRRDQVGFPTLAEEEAAKAAGRREDALGFPDLSIPDPEAGVTDSDVRTGVVAKGEDPSLSQQTDPAGAAATAAAETVERMDPEAATLAEGKGAADFVTNLIKDFQDNDNPDAAADTALAALGQIDPADAGKLSTDERLAKMKETISKFFGRNVEEENRVDALNVAMLGFLIASGDSPNALQNIARGSVQGIKEIKKTKQERMAREDKINGLVVSTVLGREDKESDQNFRRELLDVSNKHDLKKFSLQDASQMKRFAADLNFRGYALDQSNALKLALKDKEIDMLNARMQNDMNMLIKRLESNEDVARLGRESAEGIAFDRIVSAEKIAEAGNAAQFDRAVIANLPDGYSLAMLEAKNQGLEGEALLDYTIDNGKKFAAEASLTGPDSLKRAVITMVPDIMKANQSTFAEASQELYNNPEFQRLYSDQMEKSGIKLVEVTNLAGKKLPGKFVPGSIFDANGVLIGRPPAKRGNTQPGYLVVKDDGTLEIVDPDGTLDR